MLLDNRQRSRAAYAASEARYPHVSFEPANGPLTEVVLPAPKEAKQYGQYHVVVTADGGLYGRWQTLVRLCICSACCFAGLLTAMQGWQSLHSLNLLLPLLSNNFNDVCALKSVTDATPLASCRSTTTRIKR